MDGKQSITEEGNNRFKTCYFLVLIFTALQHIRYQGGRAATRASRACTCSHQHFTNGDNYSDIQSFMNNVVYFASYQYNVPLVSLINWFN